MTCSRRQLRGFQTQMIWNSLSKQMHVSEGATMELRTDFHVEYNAS